MDNHAILEEKAFLLRVACPNYNCNYYEGEYSELQNNNFLYEICSNNRDLLGK